ncbi:hypothetical protein PUN28_009712 [Cardiocondyla obscurior]
MSHYQGWSQQSGWILKICLLYFTLVSSHETVPSSFQNTPGASTLKIEAKDSEASITLGKDLILGPPMSTKASIVAATKSVPPVSLSIVNRGSSEENAISQRPISKEVDSRDSYFDSGRKSWTSKSSKTAWKRDSYLQALMHSRTSDDPREGVVQADLKTKANRREGQGPIYKPGNEYDSPDSIYAPKSPRISYGRPNAPSLSDSYSQSFRPLDYNEHYGPPKNSYGPPQNSYGPPNDGAPYYPQISFESPGSYPSSHGYGPSIQPAVPTPVYGAPYSLSDVAHISLLPSIDLGLPLALKLNAFTIAKIILKLVIFKMIVKFIAVICLLLFIPKLEIIKKKVSNKDDDEEEEERNFSSPYASLQTLNNLEDVVKSSVEKYKEQNSVRLNSTEKCTTLTCRFTQAFTFHESWQGYLNLFKSYVEEERQFTERREQ